MQRKPRILVVGSFVMDLITSTHTLPGAGETVLGLNFNMAPGGKGANQAVQAAKLGAEVTMVGKVGCDAFGDALIDSLQTAGVNTRHVKRDMTVPSSVGNVTLSIDENGLTQNRIIVVPGANMTLSEDDVKFLCQEIESYDFVLLQFEIPMAINLWVAQLAHSRGVKVMVNPAPAAPIPDALAACTTYLSPNEHEAAAITDISLNMDEGIPFAKIGRAAETLTRRGVKHLVVTFGENGAALCENGKVIHMPSVAGVYAVDPTAAGDSFVAAFSTGVCAGLTHEQAMDFARHTAAITVSRIGAQPSLPTLSMVVEAIKNHGTPRFPLKKLDHLA